MLEKLPNVQFTTVLHFHIQTVIFLGRQLLRTVGPEIRFANNLKRAAVRRGKLQVCILINWLHGSLNIQLLFIIQMKYSIQTDPNISDAPILFQSKFAKTFTHFSSTTSLQVFTYDKIKLTHIINQYGQQVDVNKNMKNVSTQQLQISQMEWQKLRLVWCGQQQWIVFFQNPFRLFFILNKYNKIVPIVLEQQLPLIQVACWVNYPQAIIYGHNQSTFTNHIYSINLVTFQSKQLPPSKNYSPGNRRNYWAYFSDNRLYIYGGIDKKGKSVEQLFWTFNLQNGNWFALDMPSNGLNLPTYGNSCEFESGKKGLVLVELYQSRLNEVQGWSEAIGSKSASVKGFYIYKGYIYFHDEQRVLPWKMKISKTKLKK